MEIELICWILLWYNPLFSTRTTTNVHIVVSAFSLNNDIYSNLNLHKVYLRQTNPSSSPWCYALTIDPTQSSSISTTTPTTTTPSLSYNFLASQVWPSARVAATICETYMTKIIHNNNKNKNNWTICELGCGSALPSLTLAKLGINVIATDIDELALYMAMKAAKEQGITTQQQQQEEEHDRMESLVNSNNDNNNNNNMFQTKIVDLMGDVNIINDINADLYILSDVFETNSVAIGAAKMTKKALDSGARVWVFAQSDRAQREVYRVELERLLKEDDDYDDDDILLSSSGSLQWKFINNNHNDEQFDSLDNTSLLLCDLDEVLVDYG